MIVDGETSSGCIAVALARELGNARLIASDVSEAALRVARRNAARHDLGVGRFCRGGFARRVRCEEFADFILSNPPYVSEEDAFAGAKITIGSRAWR